jgi:hypothetical protein
MTVDTLTPELLNHRLGTVTLDPPGVVVAGSTGQWRLVYTVGSYGIDEGGTLKLAQRFASDWEIPQFDRPTDSGYTKITTSGAAKLRAYYHTKAHARPWMKCLVIDVYDGSLAPGDTVTITLGDRSQGSPGIRAQTFQESAHEFRLLVDPTNANEAKPLPTSPLFPVVAGDPVRIHSVVPTQTAVGEPITICVRGEDRWGNPTPAPTPLRLVWEGSPGAELEDHQLTLRSPGSGWIIATASSDQGTLVCRSNPITAYADPPTLQRFWGDLHAQTAGTVGTGTEAEYFAFGRDVARLDFMSHQGNDFQIDDEYWRHLNQMVRAFHADGRFVVFPGYEWSANTPAGGDRNVIYRHEDEPIFRSSHWQIPHVPETGLSPAHPADILFQRLRSEVGVDRVLVGSHVGGRYADIRTYFDEDLAPLVEVLSCWGIFEWMLWDAFEQGYIVGVMCNSDGHKGRPGAEGPGAGEFGIAGGLTCVLAESLSREAVFQALKSRCCYGTSGPRINLDFSINDRPMGSLLEPVTDALATATVLGVGPLESLVLYRGREPIHVVRPAAFHACADSTRVRISWQGARMRGRGRRVVWNGTIRTQGATILSATTVAFDAPSDGIIDLQPQAVTFRSQTTGDTDAIDLWLDQAQSGLIFFESEAGTCQIALDTLGAGEAAHTFPLSGLASGGLASGGLASGGLDIAVRIERYPMQVETLSLTLRHAVQPPAGARTPYFVKALQCDGHAAWSSPIYVG